MRDEPSVGIIMGSDSDLGIMQETALALEIFSISYDIAVLSAHRTASAVSDYACSASDKFDIIVAGAGASAHLPGVIAAQTILPVIGVPIDSTPLLGMDSLYSIVQMPSGIPVATMAIGKAGARNAGIYAAEILSIKYPSLKDKLLSFRKDMETAILKKNEVLSKKGFRNYLK